MYIIVLLLQNHNMYRAKLQFFCHNAFTVGNKSPHKSLILTKNNTKSYTQTQSSCITSTRRLIRRWPYIKKNRRSLRERRYTRFCPCLNYSATVVSAATVSAATVSTETTVSVSTGAACCVLLPQEANEIAATATNIKTNFFIFLSF